MNEKEEYKWITAEQLAEGWFELRDGVVIHHDWTNADVVRKGQDGNYLVRLPRKEPKP